MSIAKWSHRENTFMGFALGSLALTLPLSMTRTITREWPGRIPQIISKGSGVAVYGLLWSCAISLCVSIYSGQKVVSTSYITNK
jgi:hypothetical protein